MFGARRWGLHRPSFGFSHRPSPRRWTVRRRLLVFLAVSLVPVLGSAYWFVTESIAQVEAGMLRSNLDTAEAAATRVSDAILASQRLLSSLTQEQTVLTRDSQQASRLFRDIMVTHPEFLNIAVADGVGRVTATALWDTAERPDVSDRKYFRLAMLSGLPTVSQTRLTSRSTGLPTVVVAVPVMSQQGMRSGLIIGELSLQPLQVNFSGVGNPADGAIMLLDAEGSVLTYPDWRHVADGVDFPYSIAVQGALRSAVQAVQRDGRGDIELEDRHTGEHALVAYVPVAGTSWTLTVIRPVADAYAAIWGSIFRRLIVFLSIVVATIALAVSLLRWTSRPLEALRLTVRTAMARRLPDLGQSEGDEVQQLNAAFDSLAAMLDSGAAQLADVKREVDRLNRQLKRLSAGILHAEAEQRTRMARDVHDGVAQRPGYLRPSSASKSSGRAWTL